MKTTSHVCGHSYTVALSVENQQNVGRPGNEAMYMFVVFTFSPVHRLFKLTDYVFAVTRDNHVVGVMR